LQWAHEYATLLKAGGQIINIGLEKMLIQSALLQGVGRWWKKQRSPSKWIGRDILPPALFGQVRYQGIQTALQKRGGLMDGKKQILLSMQMGQDIFHTTVCRLAH
jgi:hypothetical protein